MQEYSSAELRSFEKYYTVMLKHIRNPVKLSKRLFYANLLSKYMVQVIRSLEKPQQIVKQLLDTVKIQISLDPDVFYKFVEVLEKSSSMQQLCDKLRSTCGECDNVCLSISCDCSGFLV